jgi:hypothetical protein
MFESCRDRQLKQNLNHLHPYQQTGLRYVQHAQWRLQYFVSSRLCTIGSEAKIWTMAQSKEGVGEQEGGHGTQDELLLAFWASIGFKPVTS